MPKASRRFVCALLVTLAPLTGHGQASPYYIGVSQTFGYDSNIYRLPDRSEVALPGGGTQVLEPESSGLISTTLLLAGLDQPTGRQRLYVKLNAGYTRYADQPQLDSPSYALTAGIDWEAAAKLSGTAELSSGLKLGNFSDRAIPTGRGDNEETYNRFKLLARIGDWKRSRIWVESSFITDRVRNEVSFLQPVLSGSGIDPVTGAPVTRYTDGYVGHEHSQAVTLGVRYRRSGALVLGTGVRLEVRSQTSTPSRSDSPEADSRRNDLDLFAEFDPGGAHQVEARLSYGKTEADGVGAQDASGWSGNARWAWQATGKLRTSLQMLYDTEDRERDDDAAATEFGAGQTLAVGWTLSYAMTAKVSGNLDVNWSQRRYDFLSGVKDRDTVASLNLTWAMLRNAMLGCKLGLDRRKASGEAAVGRGSYDARSFNCFAELMLR